MPAIQRYDSGMSQLAFGDFVVTGREGVVVRSEFEPTFSSPGRSHDWESGHPAIVMDIRLRKVGPSGVKKVQILLDGGLWWVSEILAKKVEDEP